ncbi:MAG: hypothetical protein BWX80_02319 [Candidatus Hydrogenedentes bacterium ADurb.Bin101]|nr:MAG: hypothetical protein BWX80_02319 [Candidatus Hydrogenedentes bacterium ADurb.Bin101]
MNNGFSQGFSPHELHGVVGHPVLPEAQFIYRHNRGVFQTAGNARFLEKTMHHGVCAVRKTGRSLHGFGMKCRFGQQFLDDDIPGENRIIRDENTAHASTRILFLARVPSGGFPHVEFKGDGCIIQVGRCTRIYALLLLRSRLLSFSNVLLGVNGIRCPCHCLLRVKTASFLERFLKRSAMHYSKNKNGCCNPIGQHLVSASGGPVHKWSILS